MKPTLARRTVLAASLAAATSLALPLTARAQALKGGRLRVAILADMVNFDPAQFSSQNFPLIKSLYDSLIEYTAEGQAVPSLATAWTIGAGNNSVTLTPAPVGPRLRREHLVALQKLLVALTERVARAPQLRVAAALVARTHARRRVADGVLEGTLVAVDFEAQKLRIRIDNQRVVPGSFLRFLEKDLLANLTKRARFLGLHVRADRASWLAWAEVNGVHPGVIAVVRAHERAFDDIPPRSWTYAAQVLSALRPEEIENGVLVRDALGGYLPPSWVEVLLAAKDAWSSRLPFDVRALLAEYGPGTAAARELARARERGETDRFDEVVARLAPLLAGPEVAVLAAQGRLSLAAFEALCADLPGDHRERLEEALGNNPTATGLVDIRPEELLQRYAGSAAERRVLAWRADPLKRYRVGLAVTALRAHLEQQHTLAELRRSNVARVCLGQLLTHLPEAWALRLVETLKKTGITPIRPQCATPAPSPARTGRPRARSGRGSTPSCGIPSSSSDIHSTPPSSGASPRSRIPRSSAWRCRSTTAASTSTSTSTPSRASRSTSAACSSTRSTTWRSAT